MADESPEHKRWITARHESGHAVAALHYGCPIAFVSIEAVGAALGTMRMRLAEAADAVVIFCGPLAEQSWDLYVPGTPSPPITTMGTDHEGLLILKDEGVDLQDCFREALVFISKPAVQQQIDRVAQALLERERLNINEVREAAAFAEPLCSPSWRGGCPPQELRDPR